LAIATAGAVCLFAPAKATDRIDEYPSSPPERAKESHALHADLAEVTRRRALARGWFAALSLFGLALLLPLRSLGPAPRRRLLDGSRWRSGARLCREDGSFVHVDDLNVDSTVTVFPEGCIGDAQSQTALIRLPAGLEASARGYAAYSRVCTHAGCPVAIYRAAAKQLLCPCHQSVFDVVRNGEVVAGPADHALPKLPIGVAADGTLRALGGFSGPVGPGSWQRA
jgi:ubiquinol-cytochrome c reductase iron-sulfur subunit